METTNITGFNPKMDGEDDRAFIIEVADGNKGRMITVRPLGSNRFELLDEEQESMGTVQLDERNHAHCESQGCELDLPLLHSIREQIQLRLQWK